MSNIPELGTTRSRLLAFGLLFLLLGAIVRFGALPLWALYQRNTESLQEQRFQLERYRSVGRSVSKREMELEQLLADDEIGRYALSEDSPALAAAELQEKVKALIVGGGGKLTSFRVLPTKPEGEFERVSVNVRATLENDALQKVLHSLESVTPFLTVDNLVITSGQRRAARRTRRRNSRPRPVKTSLDVTFDLAGLLRPVGQVPLGRTVRPAPA